MEQVPSDKLNSSLMQPETPESTLMIIQICNSLTSIAHFSEECAEGKWNMGMCMSMCMCICVPGLRHTNCLQQKAPNIQVFS